MKSLQKSAHLSNQIPCFNPDDYLIRIETCVHSAALTAYEHKLYVDRPGWDLKYTYIDARKHRDILQPYLFCIARLNDAPVGVTVAKVLRDEISLGVYVVPVHRRSGLGTRMCNAIRFLLPPKTIVGSEGIRGSISFFSQLR